VQLAQRLADRHVADAVAAGELVDPEPRAEREVARDDVVAQQLLDVRYAGHCLPRAERFREI
jgi:hypothetical protein